MELKTLKIKSSNPEQGEFIIINEEDFDATKHVKYNEAKQVDPIQGEVTKRGRPSKSGGDDAI